MTDAAALTELPAEGVEEQLAAQSDLAPSLHAQLMEESTPLTTLHDAARDGDAAALRRLLESGADVDAKDKVRVERRVCSLEA